MASYSGFINTVEKKSQTQSHSARGAFSLETSYLGSSQSQPVISHAQ